MFGPFGPWHLPRLKLMAPPPATPRATENGAGFAMGHFANDADVAGITL